jgi:AcrR family transcriptional regulator
MKFLKKGGPPRYVDREKKMEKLREKAIELIAEGGFDGFSLRKLGEETETSAANLYTYFDDKMQLLIQCHHQAQFAASIVTVRKEQAKPGLRAGLWDQWMIRYRFIQRRPAVFQFLEQFRHSPMVIHQGPEPEAVRRNTAWTMQYWKSRGELAEMPDEVFQVLAYAPFYALVKLYLDDAKKKNKPFVVPEAVIKQTFERTLRSLRP